MEIDLISPISSTNYGGVERYALNLLDQFVRLQTTHSFRLVNFPPSVSSPFPFERIEVKYGFRDTASHFFSRRGAKFVSATLDYLVTNGPSAPPRDLVSGWNRQMGLSFGLETVGPSKIVHGLTHFLPRYVQSAHLVATVHDLGPLRVPSLYTRAFVQYMRHEFARQARSSERVITDSPTTLEDVHELYGIPRERLAFIPLGVEETFHRTEPHAVLQKHGITAPYIYYPMGTIEPRKNLAAVSEAVRRLRTELHTDLTLVVTGRCLQRFPDLDRTIEEGAAAGHLRRLGFVDAEDLPALYSGAQLCVYPSLFEGFGLPVLESMACGTPVAVSRIGALDYVAGDAAYRLADTSPESIANGIATMLSDHALRSRLSEAGLRRAKQFPWEATARKTLEVYDDLA